MHVFVDKCELFLCGLPSSQVIILNCHFQRHFHAKFGAAVSLSIYYNDIQLGEI